MTDAANILPNGNPDVAAMSGEQAQTFLDSRLADKSWAARLSQRHAETHAEFHALSRKIAGVPDQDASAYGGAVLDVNGQLDLQNARRNLPPVETTSSEHGGPSFTVSEALEQFNTLRQHGFGDGYLLERFDESREFSAEHIENVRKHWQRLEGNEEFRRLLLSGNFAAEQAFRDYCSITTARVKKA